MLSHEILTFQTTFNRFESLSIPVLMLLLRVGVLLGLFFRLSPEYDFNSLAL